jgi:hypothetical protein
MNGWAAFWIMCAVYVACDTWLYSQGHETLLWKHKTPEEKAIQRRDLNAWQPLPPPPGARPRICCNLIRTGEPCMECPRRGEKGSEA